MQTLFHVPPSAIRKRRPPQPKMRGRKKEESGFPVSSAAKKFHAELLERGRTPVTTARQMLGAGASEVLEELQRLFLIRVLPGSDGTREGRSLSYVAVLPAPAPTALETDTAYAQLQGKSGTLGTLAKLLGWDEPHTLAALWVLQKQGRAQGGPVGATVVFRVLPKGMLTSSPD